MNISYHAWKAYGECPKKYYLTYRKKTEPTVPVNDYFKLYGNLIQLFFQMFCNIWKLKTPYMPPDFIRAKLKSLYQTILENSYVDWYAPYIKLSSNDIFEEAFRDICEIMDSPNQNYFLNTKSEVDLKVSTKGGADLTGRLDFLYSYLPPSDHLMIFDGKGSGKIGKNVTSDQVLFYALLHSLHTKKIPDELGFFYFRFNTMVPVEFNQDILNHFRARVSLDVKKIMADSTFTATPKPKSCKYCDYRNGCPERLKYQAEHRRPSKLQIPDHEGIVELGF